MKKLLYLSMLVLLSEVGLSATVQITNSGFTFSPDNVNINVGDTIIFQLGSIHNAVEVSASTWNANGNTPLPGFSVPFGGGQVVGLTAGTHYYVCSPHASGGMKGRIIVNNSTGINDHVTDPASFRIFPNPTSGKFTVELKNQEFSMGNGTMDENTPKLEIYNLLGDRIISLPQVAQQTSMQIDPGSISGRSLLCQDLRQEKNLHPESDFAVAITMAYY